MGEDGFEKFFDSITPAGSYDAHDPTHRALRYTQEIAWRAGREAGMREAAIDADAATRYGKTAQAHGFSNAPPWSELAEETKQLYRYAILSAIGEKHD